jgi:tRNA(Ile)-lysidine synthase
MINDFLKYIDEHKLFDREDKVLLAVSGGIDSVVMAHLFHKAYFNFGIAHCNFTLRGEESDEDEAFVRKLAKKYKVDCFVKRFDTEGYARRRGISTQMAARELRYVWFEDLCLQQGFQYIATAHHRNDVLETILLNLAKGTGIAGFHGILPKTGKIVRPLLFASKDNILDWVAQKGITWRDDTSNLSDKYQRNMIRNQVVPLLKSLNPDIETSIGLTVERVLGVENIFYEKVEEIRQKSLEVKEGDVYIDKSVIIQEKEKALILSEMLKPYGFNYFQTRNMASLLNEKEGKLFESEGFRLNIDRQYMIISRKDILTFEPVEVTDQTDEVQDQGVYIEFTQPEIEGYQIPAERNIAALDFEKLVFPLTLRKWKEGDWFMPLGMQRKKKLSDFMIDEKIPLNLKERLLLLTSGDDVVWVVGHRIDDRYKITGDTKKIFQAELK